MIFADPHALPELWHEYIDRAVVEFAAGLPTDLKLRDGTSKWLLRQVLSRSIPLELVDRPKAGFGMPIEDWLRGPLRPWAEEHLFGPAASAFLDLAPVRAAWADHLAGRSNRAYELWDVAMFGSWADHRGITA